MIDLYCRFLNDGPSIEKQIIDCYESDSFVGIKCVDEEGDLCGVCTGSEGIRFTCEHQTLVDEITYKYGSNVIYTVEMIVVLPEHRHRGIANKLVRHFKEAISESDAEMLLVELWREPEGRIPGRVIVSVLGGEVDHIYDPEFYKDLPKYKLTCPICGEHCKCGADICLLDLKSDERKWQDERQNQKEVHKN